MALARRSACLRHILPCKDTMSRENTTITAMAAFVHRLLLRADDDAYPVAIRLLSGPQSRTSASTPLDARDSDCNHTIWNARLVLATTGLHLAQFRHKHRPLPKSALRSWGPCLASAFSCAWVTPSRPLVALGLGGLPKKHAPSDGLCLGVRAARRPLLLQELPQLVQTLLIDDLPPRLAPVSQQTVAPQVSEGGLPVGGPPSGCGGSAATADRSDIHHALWHVVTDADLRWHRAEDIDACAGTKAPHDWCIMLPLLQRVQPWP